MNASEVTKLRVRKETRGTGKVRYRYRQGQVYFNSNELKKLSQVKFTYGLSMTDDDIRRVETEWHGRLIK